MWSVRGVVKGVALMTAILSSTAFAGCEGRGGDPVLGISTNTSLVPAVRLALEESRAQGLKLRVDTLIIPEGTTQAAPAIAAAERLVGTPGIVAVVGHSNSAASLAAAPIYNRSRVVQLSPTSSAPAYSDAGPYSFRMVPPDDRQGAFLYRHLSETLPGGARLAVLHVNDDYGRGLRAAFTAALDTASFPVVLELPHAEDGTVETEVAHARDALAAARPDVVVWLGRAQVLDVYLTAIRDAVGAVPVVGGDAVAALPEGGRDERWEGVRFVEFVDLEGTAEMRAFRGRFRSRFGREASGADALTYDAVRVLLAGLAAGATTGEELRGYLASLGRSRAAFEGLAGPVSFDENGDAEASYMLDSVTSRMR